MPLLIMDQKKLPPSGIGQRDHKIKKAPLLATSSGYFVNGGVMQARYVHTNIIAQDWRKLVDFYQQVFGCIPVVADSRLSGTWLEQVSGIPNAEIRLCHLRLPGHGDSGPTLEIIAYNHQGEAQIPAANRPGFGHIAFAVEDVAAAHDEVLAAGGGSIGSMITTDLPGRGRLTAIYATDPEGNIIELQRWSH